MPFQISLISFLSYNLFSFANTLFITINSNLGMFNLFISSLNIVLILCCISFIRRIIFISKFEKNKDQYL